MLKKDINDFNPNKNYSKKEWKEWLNIFDPESKKRKLEIIKSEVIELWKKRNKSQTSFYNEQIPIKTIQHFNELKAESLSMFKIYQSKNLYSDYLGLLLLGELLQKCAFGATMDEIIDLIDLLKEYCEANNITEFIPQDKDINNKFLAVDFFKKLFTLKTKYEDKILLKDDTINIVKILNYTGFSIKTFEELIISIQEAKRKICVGIGHGIIPAQRVIELAEPLFKTKSPSIIEMWPLIQEFRTIGQSIDCRWENSNYSGKISIFYNLWSNWLESHPAIEKYLDPHCVLLFSPISPVPAGIGGIIANIPAFVNPPAADNNITTLYTLANNEDAHAFACVMRTHYANPAGGGGAGGAFHIARFRTTAGGHLVFY